MLDGLIDQSLTLVDDAKLSVYLSVFLLIALSNSELLCSEKDVSCPVQYTKAYV